MSTLNQALQRLILNQRHPSHLGRHDGITPTLPAPIIPAVLVHGGLNKNDLHDPTVPVAVQVVLTTDMAEGDTLALYWNDAAVASDWITHEHLDVGQVVFYVYPRDIPDTTAHVHYHHIGLVGDDEKSSIAHAPFEVKRTVPGNPDPIPSTPYINENLLPLTGIPDSIEASAGPLTVGVPRYQYIAENDVITVQWSSVPVSKIVSRAEAENAAAPLNLVIDADIIRDNPGLQLVVTYDIRDTVKNWSLFSLENRVDVEAPGSLHVPAVRDADDFDVLDMDALAGADVAVQLPVNGNLDVPSTGTLTWTGQPVLGPRLTYTQAFSITQATTRLTLMVPNAQAAALVGSTATVYYDGVHNNVAGRSARATVSVIGQPVELAKPRLTGVSGDTYDPDLIVGDVQEVIVPAYAFMAVGQEVTLIWEGITASGTNVYRTAKVLIEQPSQVGLAISVYIEKLYAVALAGGSLRVRYKVTAEGQSYESPTLELTVTGQVNTLPAPGTLPAFPNGQVDPDQVGATLQVVVKAGGVLQPGDSITVHWVGEPSASTHPTAPMPPTGDLLVSIAKDPYVTGNSNRPVAVSYEARRGGNLLGSSRLLNLTIGEPGQSPWPAPQVTDATSSTANPWHPIVPGTSDRENTATVELTDARLAPDDVLAVLWFLPNGVVLNVPWVPVTVPGTVSAPVPQEFMSASLGKVVSVNYVVFRGSDAIGSSLDLSLSVATIPPSALPSPLIMTAADNDTHEFFVTQLTTNAAVVVNQWPLMNVSQFYWVEARGTHNDGTPLVINLATRKPVQSVGVQHLEIPLASARALKNSSLLTLTMRIAFGGDDRDTIELSQVVYVVHSVPAMTIDPSLMSLSGFSIKVTDWPKSGQDSIGNTASRQPLGGVPPYSYQSNNPEVVSVNQNGKVTGLKNGSTRIVITDTAGANVSYPVTTSNIWQLIRVRRSGTNAQALEFIRAVGGTIVDNVWAYSEFFYDANRVYTPPLGTTYEAWTGLFESGTNRGSFKKWTTALHTYATDATVIKPELWYMLPLNG
ncbi:Ig-like domain-containing protein [Pseudomonas sp. TE3610]